MPLSKHYSGHGEEVMRDMQERYGDRAEEVFYATENKRKGKGRLSVRKQVSDARRARDVRRKTRKG